MIPSARIIEKHETLMHNDQMDVFCVIMAGGVGSRFWPMSRSSKPKQFIDIYGTGKSLLQQTFDRALRFCSPRNIYIVTSQAYRDQVIEHLPGIPEEQVLLEPMRRNTAPCIAFANQVIALRNPNAVVVVMPSDHLILDEDGFFTTINRSLRFVDKNDALLTIGIKPSRPETGYGYIQVDERVEKNGPNLYRVKSFTEKPNLEMAKVFISSGEFYWNSGVFIWSLSAITRAFAQHLPEVHSLFCDAAHLFNTPSQDDAVQNIYSDCRNISIDYGIMEKASNVFVVCAEFGWSDLGTWGSLYLNSPKDSQSNAVSGSNVMTYNVRNSLINVPNNKLVVVQGVDDVILVESDGILLLCRRDSEQELKAILNDVLLEKGEQFI